jgi:hypothetical protein
LARNLDHAPGTHFDHKQYAPAGVTARTPALIDVMKSQLLRQRILLASSGLLALIGIAAIFTSRPSQPSSWVGACFVAMSIAAIAWSTMLAQRRRRALFERRVELKAEEIYLEHFSHSGLPPGLVLELWHEVADVFNLPAGKLRPSDRFGEELGNYGITGDDLYELAGLAILRARLYGGDINLRGIKTLDCYVRALASMQLDAAHS